MLSKIMLKRWWFGSGLLAVLAAVAVVISQGPSSETGISKWTPRARSPVTTPGVASAPAGLPGGATAFVPNQGQWDHPASYVARIGAGTVFVQEDGWVLALEEAAEGPVTEAAWKRAPREDEQPSPRRGIALRLRFEHANRTSLIPGQRLGGVHHYFLGDDPARWRTDVRRFGAVRLSGIYAGIDVGLREHQGHLEYDLLLAPGADLEQVVVHLEGADRLALDADGTLVAHTALGPLRQPRPTTWQVAPDGTRVPLACDYVLLGPYRFGFAAPGWAGDLALVVDPGLIWSTFVGAALPRVIAAGPAGTPTVAGAAGWAPYPTTMGAYSPTPNGNNDAFITRLSSDGSQLLWSTFLGGPQTEEIGALDVDAAGVVTVFGLNASGGLPTTFGAFDTTYNGDYDCFVSRLSSDGSQLVWSTYLGGLGPEVPGGLAVDAAGNVTVAGTTSGGIPTTAGAFDTTYNGGSGLVGDAFVARLSSDGSQLLWSTYLGGSQEERIQYNYSGDVLALGPSGTVTVAGRTASSDFPVTPGCYDPTWNGSASVFVSQISNDGSSLLWSTFLGSSHTVNSNFASEAVVAVDSSGAVTVAGTTGWAGFPTTLGAFAPTYPGGTLSGFIARLSSSGGQLLWSTYLGGVLVMPQNWAVITALAVDPAGVVTVAGGGFPTTLGAYDTSAPGQVARLDASGSRLIYSTHLGGGVYDVALGDQGGAFVTGQGGAGFPTTPGAFSSTSQGGNDLFVTHLDMLPTGVAAYGNSSPGCSGPLAIGVTSWPQIGNALFSFTCSNGPPMGLGLLGIGDGSLTTPITAGGAQIWIDPHPPAVLVLHGATADAVGAAETVVPIPANPNLANLPAFAQYVWYDPCVPTGYTASHALAITVQP